MTAGYRELLLGCGRSRDRRMVPPGRDPAWQGLVTLDENPAVKPDLLCDLAQLPWWVRDFRGAFDALEHERLKDSYFDEIHAYEVLEHIGAQGDAATLFAQFTEIWRALRPGGYFCATVPSRYSGWLWGDPSHWRAIVPQTLAFLDQAEYVKQCDSPRPTSMSDFRGIYKADFQVADQAENREQFMFVLRAVKPSRAAQPSLWRAPG